MQAQKTGEEYIIFLYDENGSAYGMLLKNGTAETYYYYTFNVQGDIVGIIDSTGTQVVSYEYGIWGDNTVITGTLADTIGNKNPLRYRSYYFDAETGFYYLQSRYYDPEVYRFINADGYISTGQDINCYNMFAYCGNDPVNKCDPNGRFFLTATICGVAIWKIGLAIIASVALIVAADSIAKNPPSIPSISLPKTNSKPKTDSKAKESAQAIPKKTPRDPVHHIVAQNDKRAAESRQILRDVGIEPVTDSRNLVVLPRSYHASLHTNAYYNYITERLRPVAGDKAGVEATLASLKEEILANSAVGIRWD